MNSESLKFLGRRIERLLYVGSILLLLSFGEIYFTLVSFDLTGSRLLAIDSMLSQLTERRRELTSLFEAQHRQQAVSTDTEKARRVQATRKALGLPPETTTETPKSPSYEREIDRLTISAAVHNEIDLDDFRGSIDLSKSPDELIKALSAQRAALQQQPVPIWGVEGSRTVAVDYFGSSYRVSSRFGAVALFIALTLLSAAWIGSLYMTRQRELILISRLEDYKQAFPHIINILPVVLADTLMRARRKQTRKQIRLALAYNRIKLALFRSFVLLIIIVPMLAINVYCGIKLFLSLEYTSAGFMLFEGGILISGILAAVTIELVVQEWRLLWGKEFKE